jgi:hypothetical protein
MKKFSKLFRTFLEIFTIFSVSIFFSACSGRTVELFLREFPMFQKNSNLKSWSFELDQSINQDSMISIDGFQIKLFSTGSDKYLSQEHGYQIPLRIGLDIHIVNLTSAEREIKVEEMFFCRNNKNIFLTLDSYIARNKYGAIYTEKLNNKIPIPPKVDQNIGVYFRMKNKAEFDTTKFIDLIIKSPLTGNTIFFRLKKTLS